MSDDTPDDETVTIGSGGYDPEEGTTAGVENAIPEADGEFDWRGWLLVGVVLAAFLVVPALITLRPVRAGGFRTTYLLLPLVPAFALGATAVWVAVRSRQG